MDLSYYFDDVLFGTYLVENPVRLPAIQKFKTEPCFGTLITV